MIYDDDSSDPNYAQIHFTCHVDIFKKKNTAYFTLLTLLHFKCKVSTSAVTVMMQEGK